MWNASEHEGFFESNSSTLRDINMTDLFPNNILLFVAVCFGYEIQADDEILLDDMHA